MSKRPHVVWFRQDLRLTDQPALRAAVDSGHPVIPVYILDDETPGAWRIASASRWWLHHSLQALSAALQDKGATLVLRRGSIVRELQRLGREVDAEAVHCSQSFEPWACAVENDLARELSEHGIQFHRHAGTLLHQPETLRTKAGGPFKVYTPFWKALTSGADPAKPTRAPSAITPGPRC